jgi:Flp pilus assembly protein TadG
VEFAVIVPLLFLIFIGILEFAFIFYQRHFIENAAREGMRVGVRANNYETFSGGSGCTDELDRFCAVDMAVRAYLATLYKPADIFPVNIERVENEKALRVTVKVNNFSPRLLSGFVPGLANQATLSYGAMGRYEDPEEYDIEE